jgi:hypothetical protein
MCSYVPAQVSLKHIAGGILGERRKGDGSIKVRYGTVRWLGLMNWFALPCSACVGLGLGKVRVP